MSFDLQRYILIYRSMYHWLVVMAAAFWTVVEDAASPSVAA
jgi:hypothetical protein